MNKRTDDGMRDLVAFCIRGSTVVFFLTTIIVHAGGLAPRPFVLYFLFVSALALFDILICELRLEDRHLCSTIVFYGLILFLAALSAWKV